MKRARPITSALAPRDAGPASAGGTSVRALPFLAALVSLSGCLWTGGPVYPERDTTPPRVLSTVPLANQQILATDRLTAVFSEPLDPRSVVPGITIYDQASGQYALDVTIPARTVPPAVDVPDAVVDADGGISGGWTVRLQPREPLPAGRADLTLLLRTLLTDEEGNPLEQDVRVTFSTAP
ncbi:MAG TPA: Ig-like domain-containing protein [Myxococcales bacterium]|nr:Ig-like domain-containing protein [Myxococcales bacterium]